MTFPRLFFSRQGCKDVFVKFRKVRAGGGTPLAEAKTQQSCRDACLARRTCYRYDFLERPEPMCEIYDESLLLTANSNLLYDVYVRVKCIIPEAGMTVTGKACHFFFLQIVYCNSKSFKEGRDQCFEISIRFCFERLKSC